MIAPVVEEGAIVREVYFPGDDSVEWVDLKSGRVYKGSTTCVVDAPLLSCGGEENVFAMFGAPIFVQRGGGVVTAGNSFEGTRHVGAEERNVTIAISRVKNATARVEWFEDDGASNDYKRGVYDKCFVRATSDGGDIVRVTKSCSANVRLPVGDKRQIELVR